MATKAKSPPSPKSAHEPFIRKLAKEHSVSEAAVAELYEALQRGGGGMAQFGHPDLGGNGQWMRNGMIMVGDMFNHALKAKVDALCQALLPHLQDADAARSDPGHSEEPETRSSKRTKHEIEGMGQSTARRESSAWWPSEYTSSPAATGGQNDMRYAYFPREKALVVEQEGKIVVYDTTGHEFHGFGQQQTSSSGFKLRSTLGSIDLSKLPRKK